MWGRRFARIAAVLACVALGFELGRMAGGDVVIDNTTCQTLVPNAPARWLDDSWKVEC